MYPFVSSIIQLPFSWSHRLHPTRSRLEKGRGRAPFLLSLCVTMPPKKAASTTNGSAPAAAASVAPAAGASGAPAVAGGAADAALAAFLAEHKSEIEHLANGKVRCLVTGTDMPKRLELMQVRQTHGRRHGRRRRRRWLFALRSLVECREGANQSNRRRWDTAVCSRCAHVWRTSINWTAPSLLFSPHRSALLPCLAGAVSQSFWQGRAYRQGKKKLEEEQHGSLDLTPYLPHIISHKRLGDKVFCRRTKRILNKDATEIEKHMKGRRFMFAMQSYKPRQPPAERPAKTAAVAATTADGAPISGSDDVWSRLPDAGDLVEREEGEDDLEAGSDEEEDIEFALRRQVKGAGDDDDDDDEDAMGESDFGDSDDDAGVFEEVPMEEGDAKKKKKQQRKGNDESDEEEEEEEEEEEGAEESGDDAEEEDAEVAAPPAKKSKPSPSAAAGAVLPTAARIAASKAAKSARVEAEASQLSRKEASKLEKAELQAKIANATKAARASAQGEEGGAAPAAAASKKRKQVEDHKPIGPPSKRDIKSGKVPTPTTAETTKAKADAAAPGQPQRLNAADRRKLKKQQQKAKQGGGATTTAKEAATSAEDESMEAEEPEPEPTPAPAAKKAAQKPQSKKKPAAAASKPATGGAAGGAKRKRT